jgi:hypothetical protein
MGGIIFIAVFAVIIFLCVQADKKTNEKFLKKIEEEHPAKDTCGDFRISQTNELLFTLGSGTLAGFKKWNLCDISSIAFADSTGAVEFSVQDLSGNVTKGEYLTPSKKPLKEKAYKSFPLKNGQQPEEVIAFVKKHSNSIKFLINSKEV